MNDCLMWFVTKHWIAASILFPEMCLIWAVWMKFAGWAACLASYLAVINGLKLLNGLLEWMKR